MELKHSKKGNPREEIGKSDKGFKTVLVAAAVAATLSPFSPLAERSAYAEEPKVITLESVSVEGKKDAPAPQAQAPKKTDTKDYKGFVSVKTNILSLINSERVMNENVSPTNMAELNVSAIDDTGVAFKLDVTGATGPNSLTSATFKKNYDDTYSGDISVLGPLGISNLHVQKSEPGKAGISFTYSTAIPQAQAKPAEAKDAEVPGIPPLQAEAADDGKDHMINGNVDMVDIAGRVRRINLNHDWDLGGNVYSNEAGSSIYASLRYKRLLRLDGGNIWFGEQAAPFGTLSVKPELNLWNVKALYYGRVSALGNMPSILYTSHALGIGLSQPLDAAKNWRLRLGIDGGIGISYPTFDDIYASMSAGASLQYKNFLAYTLANFYWAAGTPMETAYIGYYRPRFQSEETGVQLRVNDYTGRIYADIGVLKHTYGIRATRTVDFGNSVSGDVFAGLGVTHWIPELSGKSSFTDGRNDFVAMFGITFVIGGEKMNSTNTIRYEHLQNGGVPQAQTEIASTSDPGPYGYGRSGNKQWDDLVNDAKNRMTSASSFQGFASSYAGSSQDALINTARFMGAFMEQVAYANGAQSALMQGKVFDPEAKRIAGVNNDTMLYYLQKYVNWYDTHNPNDPLPDELRNGIAVCAGIHSLMADFLRANGIPTIVASVNTRGGPHVIAVAMPNGGMSLLDYGNKFSTPPNTFDQLLRFYGQYRQAPTFQSQLFGPNGYMGTYITPEGRLLHHTIGIYTPELLKMDFLGVR